MVTLKELAAKLNVSVSTVSKALNNSPEISKETVLRVKELAETFNYKPNRAAINLKNSKTKTIGVIIPNILNHFFAKVLYGIEQEATKLGYNLITCLSNESYEKEFNSLELLANGSVDGFIMSIAEETQINNFTDHLDTILKQKIPIVLFDRVSEKVNCDQVIIDDYDAAYKATMHLINEGRKNILLINNIDELSVGKLRSKGYVEAIENSNKGLKTDILTISRTEDLEEKIKTYFKNNMQIDGVVSIDNVSGIVALNVAKDMNVQIPKNLSIIGFSSQEVLHFSSPKLSTVSQNAEEIGKTSVNLLIDKLENKTEAFVKKIETVKFSLNLRGTTF